MVVIGCRGSAEGLQRLRGTVERCGDRSQRREEEEALRRLPDGCWTRKFLRVHRKPTRISSGPPLIVCCGRRMTRRYKDLSSDSRRRTFLDWRDEKIVALGGDPPPREKSRSRSRERSRRDRSRRSAEPRIGTLAARRPPRRDRCRDRSRRDRRQLVQAKKRPWRWRLGSTLDIPQPARGVSRRRT